ncbi:MAG: exodeoxyribonuclease III, partial [Gemmatimonadales bacterium]|nr:exodeoxyribonuclease III [Gemmatimonadales bacterium]
MPKIATWNVNSIRMRLTRLLDWLSREQPDVVCLQELKVTDDDFPRAELETAGWQLAVHGQKTYNGVAILSRAKLEDVTIGMGDGVSDPEARLISARTSGARVVSAYVPNGKTVGSDKWTYKLEWLRRLRGYLGRTADPAQALVLCGDFNVAPEDRDVARVEQWKDTVLCHEEARARLREIVAWGLVDAIRLHHTGDGPYSWWDYRMLAFPKNNGLRIDHILATRPLAARCTAAWVVRDERKGKLPSDHAPVV